MKSFYRPIVILSLVLSACASAGESAGDPIDGGINIIPDSAPGTPDSASQTACTLVPQTGCPSNQACDLDGNSNPTCRAVTNAGTETSLCGAPTECAAGYVCAGVDVNNPSCLSYCANDGDCTSPGGRCIFTLGPASLCSQNCNPTTAGGCPATWACDIFQDMAMTFFLTSCGPTGSLGQGATCTSTADCAANFSCVNTGSLVCLQNCVVPGGACGVGTCLGYTTPVMVGTTEYGVCL